MSALHPTAGPEFPAGAANPPLPVLDGPVDPTVPPEPVEDVDRPARFTLMAPGWMPPREMVTQALGICFTGDGLVVMVTWDGLQWTFPGGTVEDGETVQQALVREVAEEACARVVHCQYLACQHVADPLNPNGGPSYYQTRWWARVHLDPWQPRHEMIGRCLVATDRVLSTLFWPRKAQRKGCSDWHWPSIRPWGGRPASGTIAARPVSRTAPSTPSARHAAPSIDRTPASKVGHFGAGEIKTAPRISAASSPVGPVAAAARRPPA